MKRHRVFFAVSVSPEAQKQLHDATTEWRDLPIRWAKPENIHITVLFVGAVDDEELSRMASALPLAVENMLPFDITLTRIGIGPDARRPRMVWAEGEEVPELATLRKNIEQVVYEEGRHPGMDGADTKPFRLHLTLGRMIPFKWDRHVREQGNDAPRIEKSVAITFPVLGVEFMESDLAPGGPTYTVLASAPFNA